MSEWIKWCNGGGQVHKDATVHPSVIVGEGAIVGEWAKVGKGAIVGEWVCFPSAISPNG